MTDKEQIISKCDALIDSYHGGNIPVADLLVLRRDLAVNLYHLTSFVKDTYGKAGLGYLKRKYEEAAFIVNARNEDAKAPISLLERRASKVNSVVEAKKEEIWAEAELEAFKAKIKAIEQVLSSLNQEIAYEAYERRNTHQQNIGR